MAYNFFDTKLLISNETYYNQFWDNCVKLKPNYINEKLTCIVLKKYYVEIDIFNEPIRYDYILLNLIKERKLKETQKLFGNFCFYKTEKEKENWHYYQLERLLISVEKKQVEDIINYSDVKIGNLISFQVSYNQPPLIEKGIELGGGFFEANWETIEKFEFEDVSKEYSFSHFETT